MGLIAVLPAHAAPSVAINVSFSIAPAGFSTIVPNPAFPAIGPMVLTQPSTMLLTAVVPAAQETVTYQWYRNSVKFSTAVAISVPTTTAYSYYVVITAPSGSVTSPTIKVGTTTTLSAPATLLTFKK